MAGARSEPIGINLIGRRPFEEALPALVRSGYQGVDYSTATPRLAGDAAAQARVRALTRDLGRVPAGTHSRSFDRDFLLPGERRDTFRREAVEDVRLAAFLVPDHTGGGGLSCAGIPVCGGQIGEQEVHRRTDG